MTYNVFSGTLNLTQSINLKTLLNVFCCNLDWTQNRTREAKCMCLEYIMTKAFLPPIRMSYRSWFVCLSVIATSRKNYRTDLHENFTRDVYVDKEELIKFWKSSASGSVSGNALKDSSLYSEMGHFSTVWLISLEKLIGPP